MTVERITDKTFTDLTGHYLNNISLLNLFDILEENNTYYLNIFRTYQINPDIVSKIYNYKSYDVGNIEWLDQISSDAYGQPDLWWAICMMNSIVNPFEEVEPGDNLKLFTRDFLSILIREIKEYSVNNLWK